MSQKLTCDRNKTYQGLYLQDLAEPNARAKKKKFGLKWFFSQPFRSGKESRPEVEELTGRHPFALENGAQKVLESSRPASPLPAEQPEPARSTEPCRPFYTFTLHCSPQPSLGLNGHLLACISIPTSRDFISRRGSCSQKV